MKTRSKKQVWCCECERKIPRGEEYIRNKGFTEDRLGFNVATCIPCDTLYRELQDAGVVYDRHFGALFDLYLLFVSRDKSYSNRQAQQQVADRKERHRAGGV